MVVGDIVQAKADFKAEHPEEVSIAQNQLLQLISENAQGRRDKSWRVVWTGTQVGYVPLTWLKKIPQSSLSSSPNIAALFRQPSDPRTVSAKNCLTTQECMQYNKLRKLVHPLAYVQALSDYSARKQGELSFRKGDVIRVYQKRASGWWKGALDRDFDPRHSSFARFPVNFITKLDRNSPLISASPSSTQLFIKNPLPEKTSQRKNISPSPSPPSSPAPGPPTVGSPSSNPSSFVVSPRPIALAPTVLSPPRSTLSDSNKTPLIRSGETPVSANQSPRSHSGLGGVSPRDEIAQIHLQIALELSNLSRGLLSPSECQTSFLQLPSTTKETIIEALAKEPDPSYWKNQLFMAIQQI